MISALRRFAAPWLALVVVLSVPGCDDGTGESDTIDPPPAVCELAVCAPGLGCCATASGTAACVDLRADPANCGGCGMRCAPGEVCSLGSCSSACEEGLRLCERGCVDVATNPAHCGACGVDCAPDEVCTGGLCEPCGEEVLACENRCIDPRTDHDWCGATSCIDGEAGCAEGEVCDGTGACSDQCSPEYTLCDGACFDLSSSSLSCGACGNACEVTERCQDGQCVCREGLTRCDTRCVQLASDTEHCGACGAACEMGERCRAGECTPCLSGELDCEGDCVNPLTDASACGAESCAGAMPCPETAPLCIAGTCQHPPSATLALGAATGCGFDPGSDQITCWGDNRYAQAGLMASTDPVTPTMLAIEAADVALGTGHTCALTGPGDVLCWGRSEKNQLTGGTEDATTAEPVKVVFEVVDGIEPDAMLQVVAATDYVCSLARDGLIWCWGAAPDLAGDEGASHPTPVPITIGDVVQLAAGGRHMCALERDGRAWCWGRNGHGQLGADVRDPVVSTPVQVVGDHRFVALAAGERHTCGLEANGSLWCWGDDSQGATGVDASSLADCTPETGPRCAFAPAMVELPASFGTVWCWGANESGQAGRDGEVALVTTPTRVDGLTDTATLALGANASFACATSEGIADTVCWGLNDFGQLGAPTTTVPWSPTPVALQ